MKYVEIEKKEYANLIRISLKLQLIEEKEDLYWLDMANYEEIELYNSDNFEVVDCLGRLQGAKVDPVEIPLSKYAKLLRNRLKFEVIIANKPYNNKWFVDNCSDVDSYTIFVAEDDDLVML